MSEGGRRNAGGILLLLGLAAAGGGILWKRMAPTGAGELALAADAARTRNQQALQIVARRLEPQVLEATRVPELVAALDTQVDQKTLQDIIDTEESWAAVRRSFPLTAVVAGGRVLTRSVGPGEDLASHALVKAVRTEGWAAGLVLLREQAYLLLGAPVGEARQVGADRPVLLLGLPADEKLLQQLADTSGDAVGLSSGRRLLHSAGPESLRRALPMLIGHESAGLRVLSRPPPGPDASPTGAPIWGAAAAVSKQLWLWVAFTGRATGGLLPVAPALGALALVLAVLGMWLWLAGRKGTMPGRPQSRQPAALSIHRQDGPAGVEGASQLEAASQPREAPGRGPRTMQSVTTPAVAVATLPRGAPPCEMGRYKLLRLIGEGGMAEVYIAEAHGAEGFKRHFVVKRLHPHLAARKELVSQFIDEARLQARLLHSNIVPVFDFGRAGEEYFLALEYVHGRDLEKLTQRHLQATQRALPPSVVFFVMHEVLEALDYAHHRSGPTGEPLSIVHRDVSPANVLISFTGEVKLSDFGIVKAAGRVSKTDERVVKGNVNFMSPEQARGESVDARSDLFSAGVVMFYCLTGRPLYSGDSTFNQLMRAAVGPVTEQYRLLRDLPAEAGVILDRALAQDPARRFQSAAEFARAVGALIGPGKAELCEMMATFYAEEMKVDF
jgi:hypothetical protein